MEKKTRLSIEVQIGMFTGENNLVFFQGIRASVKNKRFHLKISISYALCT